MICAESKNQDFFLLYVARYSSTIRAWIDPYLIGALSYKSDFVFQIVVYDMVKVLQQIHFLH